MPATSDLSAASAKRRKLLGWGGGTFIAALATYLGWQRSSQTPPTSSPAVPARAKPQQAAPAVAEAPPQPASPGVFSREAFVPHLNTSFTLVHEGGASAECRLLEVSPEKRITAPKQTYTSFTLLFEAKPTFLRNGGICRVKHSAMSEMQIFLSPVGKPGAKTLLEAAFTLAV